MQQQQQRVVHPNVNGLQRDEARSLPQLPRERERESARARAKVSSLNLQSACLFSASLSDPRLIFPLVSQLEIVA